ncbi:hypothetical protein K461DRAFT_149155 [Myriangium duriaei CBS 260.36]|uniref:Uncharacterized protein n=1 Tax=Myriangium duriaei CBS 260.36 TaxID=1168546 RepID=A0A9P4J541_9PEZI|nr:hypothetical protein K461DRAFT_149155 [Myriangium duriaei CBS 260.36]
MIDLTPRIGEDEAVSRYFNSSQSANFNLSVRESEEWDQLKDDMIFRSFPPRAEAEFTKIQQVKADRERPDPHPESRYPPFITDVPSHRRSGSPSPVAEPVSETGSDAGNEDDQAMDTDSDDDEMVVSPKAFTAVEVTEPNAAEPADNEHKATQALHQIAAENDAMLTDKLKQSQDPVQDRLEELGVTGSPKAHVADEAAARQSDVAQINPPPHESRRESSARRHGNGFQPYNNRRTSAGYQGNDHRRPDHRQNISGFHANGHHHGKRKFSDSGMPYGPHNVPPPPERHQDSWSAEPYGEARQRSGSVGSSTSQRTVPGGDFDANEDDHERTPRAQPHSQQPGSGRKRDYDEMERSNNNDRRRQADDVTPRMRRGRPKVPDAYRWVVRYLCKDLRLPNYSRRYR